VKSDSYWARKYRTPPCPHPTLSALARAFPAVAARTAGAGSGSAQAAGWFPSATVCCAVQPGGGMMAAQEEAPWSMP
jgi:hypothetical protein